MMSEGGIVDVRGLACPMPVVRTKKAIGASAPGAKLTVLVDNDTALQNVKRMAQAAGCAVETEGLAPAITLRITVGAAAAAAERPAVCCSAAPSPPMVVAYVNSDRMGHGDDTLGGILIKAFVQTLKDVTPRPGKVVFTNAGVHLACDGSPVLNALEELAGAGVQVVSCGTCLDFFKKLDKVRVGVVSNMYEIVTILAGADRVVTP